MTFCTSNNDPGVFCSLFINEPIIKLPDPTRLIGREKKLASHLAGQHPEN